jgi:endonuclease/exonuclease/phosphatase family metal-dependent hydrolase
VQIREAFALIEELEASAIGLQEITDPELFAREASSRLGKSWKFVHQEVVASTERPKLHIGVLYDASFFRLERATSRKETRIDERTQPTLEVRLRERASGKAVTMLVIHFKALPEGRERRQRQFAGLLSILQDVQSQSNRVVVMGDFNATEAGDRTDLQNLGKLSGMVWATEHLPCSAFWERQDDCPTSRLDHVLTWTQPADVSARGGCEDGCDLRDACPLYHRVVSDHCPVLVEMSD